jgi:hypothetical protein
VGGWLRALRFEGMKPLGEKLASLDLRFAFRRELRV